MSPDRAVRSGETRAKVIEATIQCILEEGFYRASSNRIADRSGVTWGVIQYHFGTREGLLAAAYEEGMSEFALLLDRATIVGETFEERLESFADVIWSYYRQPRYVAFEQLALNMRRDPDLDDETRALVRHHEAIAGRRLGELAGDVLEGIDSTVLTKRALIQSLRTLAGGLALTDAKHREDFLRRTVRRDPERDVLLAALASLVDRR
jgi:AcrR family transcriptional regulator